MKTILGLLIAAAIFAGCGSSQNADGVQHWMNPQDYNYRKLAEIDPNQLFASADSSETVEERVIIYNADLRLNVKQPDSMNVKLTGIAKKYEGYALTLGNTKAEIRVKADYLDKAINDISQLGKLKYKLVSGEDVTIEFMNYQIRLENAYQARDRYLELLARAEDVKSALEVEKELERLNGEIDLIEGNLNRLVHLAAYSTISIYFEEKVKPGILGYVFIGLYNGVKWFFVRN